MISTIVTLFVITLFAVFFLVASDFGETNEPFEETPSVEILPVGPGQSLVGWDTVAIDTLEADKAIEESKLDNLAHPWQWLEVDPFYGGFKVGEAGVNQILKGKHHTPKARRLLAERPTVEVKVVKVARHPALHAMALNLMGGAIDFA